MDFFSIEEFNLLRDYAGKAKTSDLSIINEQLKITYQKVENWAQIIQQDLFSSGEIKLRKSPINQGNHFESYLWAKIYPTKEDVNLKMLSYTVSVTKDYQYVVKIDTIGLLEKDPIRQKYYQFRSQLPIIHSFEANEINNWNTLLEKSKNVIVEMQPYYDSIKESLLNNSNSNINMSEITNNVDNKNEIPIIPLNLILYGPPGTGKTYQTINKAISIANPEFKMQSSTLSDQRKEIKTQYDRLVKDGQIVFTTFHQSMTYEDFVEGIKPEVPYSDISPIQYKIKDGIFKLICDKAKKQNEIILKIEDKDTIFSKEMFKDLYFSFAETLPNVTSENSNIILKTKTGVPFYLFKNSAGSIVIKAGEMKAQMSAPFNELSAVYFDGKIPTYTPYENPIIEKIFERRIITTKPIENDKKNFVLIIDEINRGNVSAIFGELITLIEESKRAGKEEALEVTLPYSKKKFSIPSNVYIIGTMNTADRSVEALDTALRRRFSFEEMMPNYSLLELETEIFGNKAKDILQTINQRICVLLDREHQIGHSYFIGKDESTILDSFYKNIIPLLQEYFFGDYGKIGLVLGNGFVRKVKREKEKQLFAKFEDYNDANQYDDLERFEIIPKKEVDINTAIQSLMN